MNTRQLIFTFVEKDGYSRVAEPVRCSFSVIKGELKASEDLCIFDLSSAAAVIEARVDILSKWSDGSAAWVSVEFPVTVASNGSCKYALVASGLTTTLANMDLPTGLVADRESLFIKMHEADALRLLTNPQTFSESSREVLNIRPYTVDINGIRKVLNLVSIDSQDKQPNFRQHTEFVYQTLEPTLDNLRLKASLDLYPTTGLVDVELCVHNPVAAQHKDGLWDSGDVSSIYFQEIGFEIGHPDGQFISLHSDDECQQFSTTSMTALNVVQSADSDGFSWEVSEKTTEGSFNVLAQGSRITPVSTVAFSDSLLTMHVPRFWQEHPSALRLASQQTSVALFAESTSGLHELQPGERKRRKLSLQISTEDPQPKKWLANRLSPASLSGSIELAHEHFNRAVEPRGKFDEALATIVVHPQEFFTKREAIDEYGWRDFGEVFADHESLYRKVGDTPLVSHYNNQYDLVLGFGLQFLRTNDVRWHELMDDLARHVTDIDIYHTVEDRVEYNHGLFWHTNHYQDAGSATHRTFSSLNYDSEDPSGSSGGPGPEHCYTTGLALHYLLTGDTASREAVMGLANWMRNYFKGDSALLGRLHSIARVELPRLVNLLRGKDQVPYAYPLTRATGNLIVSFLDAHLLSGDPIWLEAVNLMLEDVFHPDDDIDTRGLDDVESTWSHTVLLQAVLRYMAVKEALGEEDAYHEFAKQSLLAYTKWTLEHAEPYLMRPEKLEFVNDTWAAQDIRRYILMVAAAKYDSTNKESYLAKAEDFSSHLLETLRNSETLHFSRIQAIILQNLGMASLYSGHSGTVSRCASSEILPAKKKSGFRSELRSAYEKLSLGLRDFEIRSEMNWLRTRR